MVNCIYIITHTNIKIAEVPEQNFRTATLAAEWAANPKARRTVGEARNRWRFGFCWVQSIWLLPALLLVLRFPWYLQRSEHLLQLPRHLPSRLPLRALLHQEALPGTQVLRPLLPRSFKWI